MVEATLNVNRVEEEVGEHAVAALQRREADDCADRLEDASPGSFEGPEKLLELWFANSVEELPDAAKAHDGLLIVNREHWQTVLDEVRCKILSVIKTPHCTAYLLR